MAAIWTFMKNNRCFVIAVSCLIIGAIASYFIMQTKITIKDTEIKTLTQTNVELKSSKETLMSQNSQLKQKINQQQNQHQDTITYPDGTVHTVIDTSTNTQTVNELTMSIETRIKEDYEKKMQQWISEYTKTHEEEIINPKTISLIALAGIGQSTATADLILKARVLGPFGVAGGFGASWDRTHMLVGTNWAKPNFIGKVGVSLDFVK